MKKKIMIMIVFLIFLMVPLIIDKIKEGAINLYNQISMTERTPVVENVYADELVCSGENCKEKITIKNTNTAVFPDANNKSNSFITVYKDGEKTQYIAIKQNNITNCQKAHCDNIYVDDSKKLYFEFKIDDIKNKNNLRIKIDYFTVNERNNNVISVVDYDSLKFFVVENNKYYNVDDIIYKGLFMRTTTVNTYQDNFDIISENLFSDPNLKNYDSLTIRVYPFYTYYATTGAYFDFKSISIITEDYNKEEKEISKNINLNSIRNNIINREFYNATFNWIPSVSFTSNTSRQIGNFEKQRGSVFYTKDKISELNLKINSYYGMPYGFSKIGSTEEFASRIINGVYNPKDVDSIYSFSCTSSAMDAVSKNIPINSSLDWNAKLFYSSETKIVDCPEKITYNNATIIPSCSQIEKNKITSLSADEIRKEKIITNNDGTFDIETTSSGITTVWDMYSRYANLKPGDLLVHKEVCGDVASMYCSTSGHTRLVTENPVVVLKYDESSKKYVIDGENSYVYVTEIEHNITDVPTLKNIDWTAKNIANFSLNMDKLNYENSATTWLMNKKYSFESLYYGYYKRNSVGVGYNYNYLGYDRDNGFKEEIYIPLTFKAYENIDKNNGIEKPYAGLIYNDTITYFTDNYENKGAVKAAIEKIKEQINSGENIKLVGTISTNYKLTGIRFEVNVKNKEKYLKEVYPVYGLNNLQTRYSLYYEPEVEEINEYLNKNKDNLQEIKITVLYAGPNLNNSNIKINDISISSNVTPANEIVVFDMKLSDETNSGNNNPGSNDDETNSGNNNPGSNDDETNSGNNNPGSNDDETNSENNNPGSNDDETNSENNNPGSNDDETNSGNNNPGSNDDETNSGNNNPGSNDDETNSGNNNPGSNDDETNSGNNNPGSNDDETNSENNNPGSNDDETNSENNNPGSNDDETVIEVPNTEKNEIHYIEIGSLVALLVLGTILYVNTKNN